MLWILMVCAGVCGGQASPWDLRYLSHQAWSTEEGLPQSSVHAILQTRDGYLWVATEGGLARFDGVGFRVYSHAQYPDLPSDDIYGLKLQADGTLLVGTADGVVEKTAAGFDRPRQMKMEERMKPPAAWSLDKVQMGERMLRFGKELPGRVQTYFRDREGMFWIGMRNGLMVGDPRSGALTAVEALAGNSVLTVFEDAEGNHWVGTETSGLHVLRRLKFRGEPGLADLAVTSVVQAADGAMWVGTREDGLRRVRNGVVDEPLAVSQLTSGVILCLAPDDVGGVWAGTPDGLNHVSAKGEVRRITSADGLPDDYVRAVAEGPDGLAWVGSQHGLARLREGHVEKVWTAADGLGGDAVGALLRAPEGLWAGTSGGLSLVGGDSRIRNFTAKDGLGGEIVTAMARDASGMLWVATRGGGLSFFEGGRFHVAGLVSPERTVDGIVVDGHGVMWLRMDRRIWLLPVEELRDCSEGGGCPTDKLAFQYSVADGLPTDEVVAGESSGGWLARDGEMWFPTRRGVAVVNTVHLPVDTVAPPVVVERFAVDDAAVESGAEIAYGRQRITVEYAGLSFTAPSEVRYRFRLEGFDKDWTEAGNRRAATYTNLPPGRYRFVVQAVNGDGVWNLAGAEVRFRVVPPYWRRWWFIGLMVLGIALVLAGLSYLRLRRLRREFGAVLAERNRMAREIHDTLTQDFVGTSLQLDLVAQMLKKGKVEQALEQVGRTRRLVTEGLDEARQSIWELRANSSGDTLPARLTRLLQRESFAAIAPKMHCGGAYRSLEPRVEREVLRIAQEALSNVQRHAGATETTVDLHYSDEAVLLTIGDNGLGFAAADRAQEAGHYGLVGMKERAALIEGDLEVVSELGKGTTVKLTVRTG